MWHCSWSILWFFSAEVHNSEKGSIVYDYKNYVLRSAMQSNSGVELQKYLRGMKKDKGTVEYS